MAASRLNAELNNYDFSSRRLQMSTSSLRAKWRKGGDCGRVIPAAEAILLISILSTSSLRAKWRKGGDCGRVIPAAEAILLISISASASCNGHCRWWISAQYTLPLLVV